MQDLPDRRRFLQLAGTGAVASIAGCASLGADDSTGDDADENDTSGDPDGDVDTSDIPDGAVTAIVDPDQQELQEVSEELNGRVEDGELDQQEAMQKFQERRSQLIDEAMTEFEQYADETGEITALDTITVPETGVVLLEGDAETLLAALNDGEMDALVPGETFAMAQQQQQMQAELEQQAEAEAQGEGESEEDGESDAEDEPESEDEGEDEGEGQS